MQTNYQNNRKVGGRQPLFGVPTPAKGAGIAFSLSALLPTVLLFLLLLPLAALGATGEGYTNSDWYLYICYLLPQISALGIVAFYLFYTKTPVKAVVKKQKCPIKYFLVAFLLQVGLLSLSELNGLFVTFLEKFGYQATELQLPNMDGIGFLGVFFVTAVLAPLTEEMLFRGVILEGLKSGFKTIAAALVCGALFSLYHQNPVQTAYQFCCGAAYALVAVKAGSILPTIFSHFLNNAFILFLYKLGVEKFPLPVIVSGACLLAALVYLLFIDKKQTENGDETEKKSEKKSFFLFASVGLLVCAITWIAGLFA